MLLKSAIKPFTLSRLNAAAIANAVILSLACLAKGAVDEAMILLLLLCSMSVLFLALSSHNQVHPTLKKVGVLMLAVFALILLLKHFADGNDQNDIHGFHDSGKFLFFTVTFIIALFIGSCESSARIFLHALLMSGTFCLTLTFFMARANEMPSSTYYPYAHGFLNSSTAATYLGIMLLLALAQAIRFFKRPAKPVPKMVLDFIDQLDTAVMMKGIFLLFSLLLILSGLFMTGSPAAILLSLLCSVFFLFVVAFKIYQQSHARKELLIGASMALAMVVIWSFLNFGQIFTRNLQSDGFGSKTHSGYLQFAAEMGWPSLLILLATFGWLGFLLCSGVKRRKERYVTPTLGLSVWLLVALHSLLDFPLQVPGLAGVFIAVMMVCLSQTDPRFFDPAPASSTAIKRTRIRKRRSATKL